MLSRLLLAHLSIYEATIVMHTSRMCCTGLTDVYALFLIYIDLLPHPQCLDCTNVHWFIWTSSPYPGSEVLSRQLSAHPCTNVAIVMMHSFRMECTGLMRIHAIFWYLIMSHCTLNISLMSTATNIFQGKMDICQCPGVIHCTDQCLASFQHVWHI